ncbi:alkyl sulfatase dimerization domain-containing protein [Nitratireductor sp. XY-223]|uniref:alkyl sulfatase dimerization domain-containing protein n=1 Tax=Nitratireductor sp. XY-223 TaxID=2561926 RepID=UPI0010A9F767|nr:alkyl sulfatase dimerization domain-containing protein [Nitratireductor sp. XY-223]
MARFLWGLVCGIVLSVVVAGGGLYLVLNPPGAKAGGEARTFAPVSADAVDPSLEAHTEIFARSFEEVVPGIHLAIGYGLANVIIVDAPDGLIMVDALESMEAANGLLPGIRALREKTGKDVTDIIYTHNHADHVFGAGVFTADQETPVRIWAHEDTEARVHEVVNVLRPIIYERSMRQFGTFLSDGQLENAGIGPFLLTNENARIHFEAVSHPISEKEVRLQIAGETVIIREAIGETDDQLMIYLPDRKALLPADNYYHAFPNLYAIRGTPYRDVLEWSKSIDAMLGFDMDVMIPQHSRPVHGADEIRKRLTDYRDAIQFVHDQTVRMINKGMTPDEIVAVLELPPHLAAAPHLQPFYGRVDWAARAVFSGYLGWFSGDPKDLLPLSEPREAELMVELAGGAGNVKDHFNAAMERGEPEWALVLASHLDETGDEAAAEMRSMALEALGEREISATGRNYFLTSAAEAGGFEIPPVKTWLTPQENLTGFPLRPYLEFLQVSLKAEEVLDKEVAYCFAFSDPEENYTLRIRRGVAILTEELSGDCVGTVSMPAATFKALGAKHTNPAAALASGDMQVEGGLNGFIAFMDYFEQS